jgi:GT2 family glycosyltransferase
MTQTVPMTVLIRTIGRPRLLQACLESIAVCEPAPQEIVVVDQSRGDEITAVVSAFADRGARVVSSWERGTGLAFNVGLRAARHPIVLVTDDDCTVAPDWIERGWAHMSSDPNAIVTGQVLPAGDADAVPSIIDDPQPRDYTGEIHFGALYTGNCCLNRDEVIAMGGFDELIRPVAEDNDLCYRWLKAGRSLRYEPDLVVWHHEWRSGDELVRWYVQYAKSQGMFYAKHLRRGDMAMARYIAYDLYQAMRGIAARVLRGRSATSDYRRGILVGLPAGLARGLWVFRNQRGAG